MADDPNLEPIINLMNGCFLDEGIFNQFIIGSFLSIYNKLQNVVPLSGKISQFVLFVYTDRNISKLLDKIRDKYPRVYEEHRNNNIYFFEEYEPQAVKDRYQETEAINKLEQYLQPLSLEHLEQLKNIYQSCRPDKADKIVHNLNEIITQLNRFTSDDKKYLSLIQFVDLVKQNFPQVEQNLENWLEKYGNLFGYADFLERSPIPGSSLPANLSESSLLIYIEQKRVNCLKLQAWFWSWSSQLKRSNCRCIQEPDIIMIDDNLSDKYQDLSEKLNQLIQSSNYLMKNVGSENLRIEFFLPTILLKELKKNDFELDWLKIKVLNYPVEIGREYPVIFRLAERLDPNYQSLKGEWKEKWKNLGSHHRSIIPYNHPSLQSQLCQPQTIGVMLDSVSHCEDFLELICLKSVPIALWSRCDLQTTSSLTEINRILSNPNVLNDFKQLPREIKNERNAAPPGIEHIGRYICLLWDDPERMPPDPKTPENALMPI